MHTCLLALINEVPGLMFFTLDHGKTTELKERPVSSPLLGLSFLTHAAIDLAGAQQTIWETNPFCLKIHCFRWTKLNVSSFGSESSNLKDLVPVTFSMVYTYEPQVKNK